MFRNTKSQYLMNQSSFLNKLKMADSPRKKKMKSNELSTENSIDIDNMYTEENKISNKDSTVTKVVFQFHQASGLVFQVHFVITKSSICSIFQPFVRIGQVIMNTKEAFRRVLTVGIYPKLRTAYIWHADIPQSKNQMEHHEPVVLSRTPETRNELLRKQ